jgi:hypothetical protein
VHTCTSALSRRAVLTTNIIPKMHNKIGRQSADSVLSFGCMLWYNSLSCIPMLQPGISM